MSEHERAGLRQAVTQLSQNRQTRATERRSHCRDSRGRSNRISCRLNRCTARNRCTCATDRRTRRVSPSYGDHHHHHTQAVQRDRLCNTSKIFEGAFERSRAEYRPDPYYPRDRRSAAALLGVLVPAVRPSDICIISISCRAFIDLVARSACITYSVIAELALTQLPSRSGRCCRDSIARQSGNPPDRQYVEKVSQFFRSCDQAQIQLAPDSCAYTSAYTPIGEANDMKPDHHFLCHRSCPCMPEV